jgi:hypothetical protein
LKIIFSAISFHFKEDENSRRKSGLERKKQVRLFNKDELESLSMVKEGFKISMDGIEKI